MATDGADEAKTSIAGMDKADINGSDAEEVACIVGSNVSCAGAFAVVVCTVNASLLVGSGTDGVLFGSVLAVSSGDR